ncbi:hypothetical protein VP01_686g1 [Puccinia sorghi]|uniref:Uncharacterized protein n=1 Tax=Puccinia sorghi TaxID=27349 RepID=A0A0L6UF67_9BASI|nr:hypothetical protein VP01_686g1 [Puccinia sorghi]
MLNKTQFQISVPPLLFFETFMNSFLYLMAFFNIKRPLALLKCSCHWINLNYPSSSTLSVFFFFIRLFLFLVLHQRNLSTFISNLYNKSKTLINPQLKRFDDLILSSKGSQSQKEEHTTDADALKQPKGHVKKKSWVYNTPIQNRQVTEVDYTCQEYCGSQSRFMKGEKNACSVPGQGVVVLVYTYCSMVLRDGRSRASHINSCCRKRRKKALLSRTEDPRFSPQLGVYVPETQKPRRQSLLVLQIIEVNIYLRKHDNTRSTASTFSNILNARISIPHPLTNMTQVPRSEGLVTLAGAKRSSVASRGAAAIATMSRHNRGVREEKLAGITRRSCDLEQEDSYFNIRETTNLDRPPSKKKTKKLISERTRLIEDRQTSVCGQFGPPCSFAHHSHIHIARLSPPAIEFQPNPYPALTFPIFFLLFFSSFFSFTLISSLISLPGLSPASPFSALSLSLSLSVSRFSRTRRSSLALSLAHLSIHSLSFTSPSIKNKNKKKHLPFVLVGLTVSHTKRKNSKKKIAEEVTQHMISRRRDEQLHTPQNEQWRGGDGVCEDDGGNGSV